MADTKEAEAFLSLANVTETTWGNWTEAETGWDDASSHPLHDCEKERNQGRPGYCRFLADQVSAAIDVGAAADSAATAHSVPTQVVGVEVDPFGNVEKTRATTAAMVQATSCYFVAGSDPTLVSTYSSPWHNKFWFDAAVQGTATFVAGDGPLKSSPATNGTGYQVCNIADNAHINDGSGGLDLGLLLGIIGLGLGAAALLLHVVFRMRKDRPKATEKLVGDRPLGSSNL
eukprot:7387959-Prymnesium_polylepis.2